eukprot:CAMPEP_0168390776 /NCGR_PEP_ID=MMETSP0228-20121227/17647_1 /TAXON_ID=133427 /ORGANISM="Protoceratium reticulatum, Strain CCCM 535 (=CCMP 1889)" /LENGTH=150 /DNA_ID=CAMNT_0008404077 /DNA_START=47 /DNA_END=499 /DNA_ORIENTATION=-
MKANQAEHEALQVLHEVVEDTQALRVLRGLDVRQRPDLGRGKGDVLLAADDLKLLTADAVGRWPVVVVLLQDLAVFNCLPQLLHDGGGHVALLPDHHIVLVVRVVGIAQPAIWPELELQELVPELALVPNVVADVELIIRRGHGWGLGHS